MFLHKQWLLYRKMRSSQYGMLKGVYKYNYFVMYTLYIKPGCPFCAKVLELIEDKKIEVELKSTLDEGVVEELIAHGGKRMVPYLVDAERGVAMYESDEIVAYLVTRMSGDAGGSINHDAPETAPSESDAAEN